METNSGRHDRALKALSLSRRHHLPLSETAVRVGLRPEEVLDEVGEAFEVHGNDWLAARRDAIPREMQVITDDGPEWFEIRDSRLASRLGQQHNAIAWYLDHGDPSRLQPTSFRVDDRVVRVASDPQTIDRLAAGGEIHLELYRR